MMNTKGYGNIPSTLFECITFIVRALPVRSVPTFIELLVGAMITQAGFVTEAWLAINPVRSWNAYYKWLQHGKWSWIALGVQMAKLMVTLFPQPVWFLLIDDTFIYRCSKKAPGSTIHHQHGNKTNRPKYARGQCWVTMALSISTGLKQAAIPLLSRLMRTSGNSTKLDAAKLLLQVIAPVFTGQKRVVTLVDSWFMKWPYLECVLSLGFHAIGQVRYDTALFGLPVLTGKRGRPRKYGDRFTPEVVAALTETREYVFIYGKWQWVRYRSAICLARFMKGRKVRVVWMQFEDENGKLSKQRLILSTLSDLMPQQIFVYYAKRWPIEDLFNQMKNRWGWKDSWQQSRQVLHRWTQILSIAYALPQILSTYCGEHVQSLMQLTPWRKENLITAGRVHLGLQMILGNVRIREWWSPKYRIFRPPVELNPPSTDENEVESLYGFMSENNLAGNHPPPS